MVYFSKAALLPALAAALGCAAQAPSSPKSPEPALAQRQDPADPRAAVPTWVYQSPLSRYQAFTEAQVAPWRETNEQVRQRGGWRAYAREAQAPASAASAPPATASAPPAMASAPPPAGVAKPPMPGHSGHEMK